MDKKTGIILGIIGAIIVVLVAVVFVMDAQTEKVDKNTLLTIEGEEYSTEEFEKFAKIYNHEINDDINKVMTEDETLATMDQFLLQKIYFDAAAKHNITLESGETSNFESDYDADSEVLLGANISKDDYIEYKTEYETVQKLKNNLGEYYELTYEIYESIRDAYETEGLYNTYGYRLMTIPYEVSKSGDASGDSIDILESGDVSGDASGDTEDLSRDAQFAIAEDVLARIKSGESFEELAKEFGSTRLSFSGNEYKLINGDLEYTTTPLLESKLGSTDLYNIVLEMESGEISDVIEDEEGTSFQIVRVESKEDGFVGEGEKELKSILLNEYADDVVAGDAHYEMNQSAYIRALYKK